MTIDLKSDLEWQAFQLTQPFVRHNGIVTNILPDGRTSQSAHFRKVEEIVIQNAMVDKFPDEAVDSIQNSVNVAYKLAELANTDLFQNEPYAGLHEKIAEYFHKNAPGLSNAMYFSAIRVVMNKWHR